MKKMAMFLVAGIMFAVAACGGGGGESSMRSGTSTTSPHPAFIPIAKSATQQEYSARDAYYNHATDPSTTPALAFDAVGLTSGVSINAQTPAVNEIPITISGLSTGPGDISGKPFVLISPAHPAAPAGTTSLYSYGVKIDFGTQAIHKLTVVFAPGYSNKIGWGLQCNTDVNCIAGPITYGEVPLGMDVTELKTVGGQGDSETNLDRDVVFAMTTTGVGTVDKVGWSIFSR